MRDGPCTGSDLNIPSVDIIHGTATFDEAPRLLIAALACCRTETVDAVRPEAQPALTQPLPWALEMATEWVDAVRTRDLERLARVTAYPFELRDTGRDASCGRRWVMGRDDPGKAVDCLFRSERLHRAMTDTPVSGFDAYDRDSPLANWIEPWWRESEHKPLQRVMTMVATVEGYEYDFQMLMPREGVRVVWKLGAFESRD